MYWNNSRLFAGITPTAFRYPAKTALMAVLVPALVAFLVPMVFCQ